MVRAARARGGLRVAAAFRVGAGCRASGAGLGAGAGPAHDLPPTYLPARRVTLGRGGGGAGSQGHPGWQLWCEPPPTRSDRGQGRQGRRAGVGEWWDEGVPSQGPPLSRGDCRDP